MSNEPIGSARHYVQFRPISIVKHGDEYIVGNATINQFVSLPEIGASIIRCLQSGYSVEEATKMASDLAGVPVDVSELVTDLRDLDLIVSTGPEPFTQADVKGEERPTYTPFLFTTPAWFFYGTCAVFSVLIFTMRPELRPSLDDAFAFPDPALSLAAYFLLTITLSSAHELYHYAAALASGVPAQVRVSRRAFFLVLETDLTGLLSIERRRRYGPLLAGMALDATILAAALAGRLTIQHGYLLTWRFVPLLERILGVVVLVETLSLLFQFLCFLRTDVYAVIVTARACTNLSRVTWLMTKQRFLSLTDAEYKELSESSVADTSTAKWFSLISVAGGAILFVVFFSIWLPGGLMMSAWLLYALPSVAFGSKDFWEAATLAALAGAEVVALLAVIIHEQRQRLSK